MIIKRACDGCGKRYETKSRRSRFCSGACRTRASRASGATVHALRPKPTSREGANVAARRAELESLGCVDSGDAVQVLTLAARLDACERETGNSAASVSRELRALMAEIRAKSRPASALRELRERRDRAWA